jgi:hypothetical protein
MSTQLESGRFTKDYNADIKNALNLLDEYDEKKDLDMPRSIEVFMSVQRFIRGTRLNKFPLNLPGIPKNSRPTGYLPFSWQPDAETTLLHSLLCFRMFLISYNLDDYLEGAVSLMVVEKSLAPGNNALNEKLFIHVKKLHDACVPEVLKRWV